MPSLSTIGYERRELAGLIGLLRDAQVNTLVDVRDVPWSHKPGFSKGPLRTALAAAGIGYAHAGFAGNPKWLRSIADTHDESLHLYEWYLGEFGEVELQLEELIAGLDAEGKRACLMCFEREPEECHRAILADAWKRRGKKRAVTHL